MAEAERPERYRLRPDIRYRIVDREAVILRQAAAENLVLNEVGSNILQWIDGGCTVSEVARRLGEEYDVSPERLAQDLPLFLDELEEAGIVEVGTEEAGTVEAGTEEPTTEPDDGDRG